MTRRHEYADLVTRGGYRFGIRYEYDNDAGPPWDRSDGHGIVSAWTRRDKRPGELVLVDDRGCRRYYDFAATILIAQRDQWGTAEGRRDGETARAYRARAVRDDFAYLRAWCLDAWAYVGVVVDQLDDDDRPVTPRMHTALWGVETYRDYHHEVAAELVADLLTQIEVPHPDVVLSEN